MKNYVKPDLFIDNLFADKNVAAVDPYMPVDPGTGGIISGQWDDLWSALN